MELLSGIFTSVLSGGATGLLGVAIHRYFDVKSQKVNLEISEQKNRHEIHMMTMQQELMSLEASANIEIAAEESFAESFDYPMAYASKAERTPAQEWLMLILDLIRGLVRPALTLYLCLLTSLIYAQSHMLLKDIGGISMSRAADVVEMSVNTVLYLTTTCVLWWFGTRNKQKPPAWS